MADNMYDPYKCKCGHALVSTYRAWRDANPGGEIQSRYTFYNFEYGSPRGNKSQAVDTNVMGPHCPVCDKQEEDAACEASLTAAWTPAWWKEMKRA